MANKPIFNIYGGLDLRHQYQPESSVLFMTEAKNIDIVGKMLRRARGQTEKIEVAGVSWLGLTEHELDGIFYMRGVADDGKYYHLDPFLGTYSAEKTGLSGTQPYFFLFTPQGENAKNFLITCTGADDPFADDGASITQTGFYDENSVYGQGGFTFNSRAYIWHDETIYWSALNVYDDWAYDADDILSGGSQELDGKIISARVYGTYALIFTNSNIYFLSGWDRNDREFSVYSSKGIYSKYSQCQFDEKIYVWNNGLYPVENLGEINQIRVQQPLSFRIEDLVSETDRNRLDEIIMVPYEKRKQIWIYVPVENESNLYRAIIANFQHFNDKGLVSFYYREGNNITCSTSFNGQVYTGTSSGKIYLEDSGNTFDGTDIDAELYFEPLTFGTENYKTATDLQLAFSALSVAQCTVNMKYDGSFHTPSETQVNMIDVADDYYELDADELDSVKYYTVADRVYENVMIENRFKAIQIGISCENTGDDFLLYGMTFINLASTNEY